MVCFIPENGIYVGYTQALCISSEINSLLDSGVIDRVKCPFLVELMSSIHRINVL